MQRNLDALLQHRNIKLILLFLIFIAVQFIFAAIYFRLYRRRRENFTFNSDILKNQSDTVRISTERDLIQICESIKVLQEVKEELDRGVHPVVGRSDASFDLPSGRKCVIEFLVGPYGPGGNQLRITGKDGQLLLRVSAIKPGWLGLLTSLYPIETAAEWQSLIPHLRRELESKQQEQTRRLNSISTALPDVWSYWDFFYFSTILQTTVGLGDILPNSTTIRMIVTAQILIGYALLIVVLNIVLAGG